MRLAVDLVERLPEPTEAAAYYVVSEALTNVGKHAQATSASVCVRRGGLGMVLDITMTGSEEQIRRRICACAGSPIGSKRSARRASDIDI